MSGLRDLVPVTPLGAQFLLDGRMDGAVLVPVEVAGAAVDAVVAPDGEVVAFAWPAGGLRRRATDGEWREAQVRANEVTGSDWWFDEDDGGDTAGDEYRRRAK